MGLKEPFDCAVCLCEFLDSDRLRLLPMCSHAFHIHCIDTWLLSNSTCPLCRGLISSWFPMENPLFEGESREQWNFCSGDGETDFSSGRKPGMVRGDARDMRIFSVRLGKFRSLNNVVERAERDQGETSTSCNLDERRCYSMGTFQYIVGNSDLQVALSSNNGNSGSFKLVQTKRNDESFVPNGDRDGKKISAWTRGDSFSVSKIWLWSKKSKFPDLPETNINQRSLDVVCQ